MKNGKCTRCESSEVYAVPEHGQRGGVKPSYFSAYRVQEYLCASCGLVETYLADMSDADKLKAKCTKVETKA